MCRPQLIPGPCSLNVAVAPCHPHAQHTHTHTLPSDPARSLWLVDPTWSVPVITCSRAAQFCVVSLACVDLLLAVSCTTVLQADQLRKISEMHEEMMANQTRQQVRHCHLPAPTHT